MEVEVRETCRLTRHGIRSLLLADDNRCTTKEVAGSDKSLLRQNEHRARAFDLLIDKVDTLYERATHVDEQRYEFRLVDIVGRELAEVHATLQQLVGDLAQVVDLRYRHHGIATEVRVHDDGLRVGITDDADALLTRERVEFILEFRTEIVALQVMDLTAEAFFLVEHNQTCTLRAEV